MPKGPSAQGVHISQKHRLGPTSRHSYTPPYTSRLCMHAAGRQRMELKHLDWNGVPGGLTDARAATSCHKSPLSPEGLAPMQAGARVPQQLVCEKGGRHQPAPASERLILCSQVQRDGALGDALLLLLQVWEVKARPLHDIPLTLQGHGPQAKRHAILSCWQSGTLWESSVSLSSVHDWGPGATLTSITMGQLPLAAATPMPGAKERAGHLPPAG